MSRRGGSPVRRSVSATSSTKSCWWSWRAETLTLTVSAARSGGAARRRASHAAAWRHGLAQHPAPERHDQPRALGARHEVAGADRAERGVRPARERLDGAHRAVLEADERLVGEPELPARDGLPQLGVEALPRAAAACAAGSYTA
jgi:hypothetical protein